MTVLGSLAVLRVDGAQHAPHPATFQYVWVGRCAAEGASSVFMRCSRYKICFVCLQLEKEENGPQENLESATSI